MPDPSEVTLDGDCAVVVTRVFEAPRPLVWRAFTEPAILTRWLLGPPGWEMHVCEVEVKVGGVYRWRWRNTDLGQEFGFTGTYSAVEQGVRLEDQQTFDQGTHGVAMGDPTTNIVVFEDVTDAARPGTRPATRVITRIEYPDAATRTMVMSQGMSDGMEMSYTGLDRLLPQLS